MHSQQLRWTTASGWTHDREDLSDADLLIFFATRRALACGSRYRELRAMFPKAQILGCSSGGQIAHTDVSDDEIAGVAMRFAATEIRLVCEQVDHQDQSRACGERLSRKLMRDDLAGIFVLSDGLRVNGGNLVAGITATVGHHIPVTGGLAGDGAEFNETLVSANCEPRTHLVGAIGFYGDAIRIRHGSAGGWDRFGPRRRVTRARGNVVLELDGQPALDLYERYLDQEEVQGLPGTALRFPLQIQDPDRPDHEIIRTVLAIDREQRSLTFAGDVPEGWMARLMRGNFDQLAAGAADAARQARQRESVRSGDDEVSLIVSCVGRRLLMGQNIIDELEAMDDELGGGPRVGFYSYGEISPHPASGVCVLHNQIMAVTAISEAAG
jgi:hypothetical protein